MAVILNRRRAGAANSNPEVPITYERQVGAGLLGVTAVIVGAWGLICGYIGPYFGFRPLAYNAWTGSLQEGLLHAAPGAAAVVGGLILMAMGPARRAVRRFGLVLPGALLLAAGAWFVIGPVAWPAIESGAAFVGAGPLRNLLNVAGASYAPGLALVMLGGMALKASIVPPVAVEDPMEPVEADREVDRGVAPGGPIGRHAEAPAQAPAEAEPTTAHSGV